MIFRRRGQQTFFTGLEKYDRPLRQTDNGRRKLLGIGVCKCHVEASKRAEITIRRVLRIPHELFGRAGVVFRGARLFYDSRR